jgi:hypothetical protein
MHGDDERGERRVPAAVSEGDEDRRAILARRQRFIALALAGLGGTAGACAGGRDPATTHPDDAEVAGGADSAEGGSDPAEAEDGTPDAADSPPGKRTKRKPRVPPGACLRIALPEDEP